MKKFILAKIAYSNKHGDIITKLSYECTKEEIADIKKSAERYSELQKDYFKQVEGNKSKVEQNRARKVFEKMIGARLTVGSPHSIVSSKEVWNEADMVIPCIDKDEFLEGIE
jgi:hypothetical protein